jgi:succinyl-diaminopimelate desuccinylase
VKTIFLLKDSGFDSIQQIDANDDRVPSKKRPNIIACMAGETKERLVIVSHVDVVPPGEISLWTVTNLSIQSLKKVTVSSADTRIRNLLPTR